MFSVSSIAAKDYPRHRNSMVSEKIAKFGVIVVCCESDFWSAKATCASVRYFMPGVPICLLIDGTFVGIEIQKAYDTKAINRTNVCTPFLKSKSFGYGVTKMISFWESPFETFLLLDADTVLWGDVRKHANFDDYDLIIDEPQCSYTEFDVNKWFFDTNKIEMHFPDFSWKDRPYVCTGVIFARRDIFPLEDYIALLGAMKNEPSMFHFGEMGLLNFLMFRGADACSFRLGKAKMQTIVQDFPQDDIKTRFSIRGPEIHVNDDDVTVLHYAGVKAYIANRQIFTEPMTHFRRQFKKDVNGRNSLLIGMQLRIEEFFLRHSRLRKLCFRQQ